GRWWGLPQPLRHLSTTAAPLPRLGRQRPRLNFRHCSANVLVGSFSCAATVQRAPAHMNFTDLHESARDHELRELHRCATYRSRCDLSETLAPAGRRSGGQCASFGVSMISVRTPPMSLGCKKKIGVPC